MKPLTSNLIGLCVSGGLAVSAAIGAIVATTTEGQDLCLAISLTASLLAWVLWKAYRSWKKHLS